MDVEMSLRAYLLAEEEKYRPSTVGGLRDDEAGEHMVFVCPLDGMSMVKKAKKVGGRYQGSFYMCPKHKAGVTVAGEPGPGQPAPSVPYRFYGELVPDHLRGKSAIDPEFDDQYIRLEDTPKQRQKRDREAAKQQKLEPIVQWIDQNIFNQLNRSGIENAWREMKSSTGSKLSKFDFHKILSKRGLVTSDQRITTAEALLREFIGAAA